MHKAVRTSILAAAVVLAPTLVSAQTTQRGASAVGLDVGVFLPPVLASDNYPGQNFDRSSRSVDGFYERYLRRRVSIRLGTGWWNPKRDNVGERTVRYLRAGGDLIFKGRGDAVNVYVGAGGGMYRLRGHLNSLHNREETALKPGAALLVGGEFFPLRALSLNIEGRYHAVRKVGPFTPDGLSLSCGFRKFF